MLALLAAPPAAAARGYVHTPTLRAYTEGE